MKSGLFSFFRSLSARRAVGPYPRLQPFRSASQVGTDRRAVLPSHPARWTVLSVFLLLPLATFAALPHASSDTSTAKPAHASKPDVQNAPVTEPAHISAPIPQSFSTYQPILDRMPFGTLPPNFNPNGADAAQVQTDAQVQAEQQKLAKQVNMSCVNITPEGTTAIGFTDLSEKPPINYYLLVGATGGGWTVVDADYDDEWAQIQKDGVTITLKLGKGLIDAPPPRSTVAANTPNPPAQDPTAAPTGMVTRVPGLILRPSEKGLPPVPRGLTAAQQAEMDKMREEMKKIAEEGGDVKSYRDRLRERAQKEKADKAAAEETARTQLQELARKITQDELKKKERETNLNLIEQGARPISDIELTPEEEQALVDKGVLAQ